jgi:hypothetical protein
MASEQSTPGDDLGQTHDGIAWVEGLKEGAGDEC